MPLIKLLIVSADVPSTYFFSSPNYVLLYFQGMFFYPHIFRSCYTTMDFAMAAPQNRVFAYRNSTDVSFNDVVSQLLYDKR